MLDSSESPDEQKS